MILKRRYLTNLGQALPRSDNKCHDLVFTKANFQTILYFTNNISL